MRLMVYHSFLVNISIKTQKLPLKVKLEVSIVR